MNNYLFIEDSRKYKRVMLVVSIICYLAFAVFSVFGILHYCKVFKDISDGEMFLPLSIVFLAIAIYCTWALVSKYLKYFMFISSDEMRFFADKKEQCFQISDFKEYKILKKSSWIMGGHWVFELTFQNGNIFTITSFKGQQLEEVLKNIS